MSASVTSLLVQTRRGLTVKAFGADMLEPAKSFAKDRNLRLVEQTITTRELAA